MNILYCMVLEIVIKPEFPKNTRKIILKKHAFMY